VCCLRDRPPASVNDIFMKKNAYSFGRHAWAASIVQKSCTAGDLEMLAIDKLLLGMFSLTFTFLIRSFVVSFCCDYFCHVFVFSSNFQLSYSLLILAI